ncbi:ABC transporter ATP-binding protein [Demequina sp. SYSU T00192]|uniref:ABC transporter ATP-binding protein n=1 Tax=Demequina litoralis TaxID=3051660 RepID=A0ABT8G697_9MICO|nr:ABC transporter ATP-binding protein [Demequina sp. SYSU T00192]MDN4474663.1 ABC transporter ATP-binding protein [Demequina sp. SYSU T00192]
MSLLTVEIAAAGYGPATVLHEVGFEVATGGRLVVLGANGAGKTTLLRTISGLTTVDGSIRLDGTELVGLAPHRIAGAGIAHVPQGRGTFGDLTVRENLLVGGATRPGRAAAADADRWMERFPRLGERAARPAAGLSGGEQQLLAIARALMSTPRLLLLDEPSLGLAPKVTSELFSTLDELCGETGTAMLLVEQNAELALGIAETALVIESGRITVRGSAAELRDNDDVRRAYLGV